MTYKIISATCVLGPKGEFITLPPCESNGYAYADFLASGGTPLPADPVPIVFPHISPRQFRQALNQLGLRTLVENFIATADQNTKDWYQFSTYFDRYNPVTLSAATQLGKTSADLDALWRLGATL
jgi:hypothetical protein